MSWMGFLGPKECFYICLPRFLGVSDRLLKSNQTRSLKCDQKVFGFVKCLLFNLVCVVCAYNDCQAIQIAIISSLIMIVLAEGRTILSMYCIRHLKGYWLIKSSPFSSLAQQYWCWTDENNFNKHKNIFCCCNISIFFPTNFQLFHYSISTNGRMEMHLVTPSEIGINCILSRCYFDRQGRKNSA